MMQGPFKKVDRTSYMMSTNDLMSFVYLTLPKGKASAAAWLGSDRVWSTRQHESSANNRHCRVR